MTSPVQRQRPVSRLPRWIAAGFLVFIALATGAGRLPPAVFGLYGLSSSLTLIAYAMDKSAARRNGWRIRENTLHLLALIGGWPGALVAQNRLRHKSAKKPFLTIFWLSVLLNCIALGLVLTASSGQALKTLLGSD